MAEFEKYSKAEHIEHTIGAGKEFNTKSGGDVNPFGEFEKKSGNGDQMNAEKAFTEKTLRIVDAMGTDSPKKDNKGQKTEKGDHFVVGEVTPEGQDAGKTGTGKTIKRKA